MGHDSKFPSLLSGIASIDSGIRCQQENSAALILRITFHAKGKLFLDPGQ